MKEYKITKEESGGRLLSYLRKRLPKAPDSFFYRMLRKKNIVVNAKKADPKLLLSEGDTVRLFLSDETMASFEEDEKKSVGRPLRKEEILYENEDILIFYKERGLLSQKSRPEDESANDRMLLYLSPLSSSLRPSITNRLDRNTDGILLGGKTLFGLQSLSLCHRNGEPKKLYLALVRGVPPLRGEFKGNLERDEASRVSRVSEEGKAAELSYIRLDTNGEVSLLQIHLKTGRTHQIRSQLSHEGYPLVGDQKYGDREKGGYFLHAGILIFPEDFPPARELQGKRIQAELPASFRRELRRYGLKGDSYGLEYEG